MAWSSLIDILTRGRRVGYLVRDTHSLAFFSNNTLCVRKTMLEQIGPYDEALSTSEDVEFCARIARDRWLIYKCPDMLLRHRARPGLRALLAQWWGYGRNIPMVYRKHSPRHVEAYLYWPPNRFVLLMRKDEMPFTACVFIHPFWVMHLAGLLFLLAWSVVGMGLGSAILGAITLLTTLLYVLPDLPRDRTRPGWAAEGLKIGIIRYLLNLCFTLSHLFNSHRGGCIYLPNVVSERRDGSEFGEP